MYSFCFFNFEYEGNFRVQAPGGLYLEGLFVGRFFALRVWGAYVWGGLYMDGLIFRTFTGLAFITVTKNYWKPTNKLFEFIKAFIKSLVDNCLRFMFSDSIL